MRAPLGHENIFLPLKKKWKPPSKVTYFKLIFSSTYCQPAKNQPESHNLFHKNGFLRDFFIMTLYTADTSSKFPHENSATVSKDIDYLIVHKITGLSMSLPKNSDHQNYQYLLFFDSYTKLNYDLFLMLF